MSKYSELETLYKDKNIVDEQDYINIEPTFGSTTAYVALEQSTGSTFLLKKFYKTAKEGIQSIYDEYQGKSEQDVRHNIHVMHQERKFCINELVASDIYRLMLFDRVPRIQLVTGQDNKILYIRSKFFAGEHETLSDFSREFDDQGQRSSSAANSNVSSATSSDSLSYTFINYNNPKLNKIIGFEKAIASCTLMGESDYHAGNFIVQTKEDDNVIMKIDHGHSFTVFHKDITTFIQELGDQFQYFEYQKALDCGNMQFSIKKYSDALHRMLNEYRPDVLINMIDRTMHNLKHQGFDVDGLDIKQIEGSADITSSIRNYDDLGDRYKDMLIRSFDNTKTIVKDLDIITKFSNVSVQFKNGQWISQIGESPYEHKSPVLYAAANNIKIEDKNPLIWASENLYLLDNISKGEGYSNNNIIEPIEYILHHKTTSGMKLSHAECEFISYVRSQGPSNNIMNKTYQDIFNKQGTITSTIQWLHDKSKKYPYNSVIDDVEQYWQDITDIIVQDNPNIQDSNKKVKRKREEMLSKESLPSVKLQRKGGSKQLSAVERLNISRAKSKSLQPERSSMGR